GLLQFADTEGSRGPPYVALGQSGLTRRDLVEVSPRDRVVAGVEIRRRFGDFEHGDRRGKSVVELALDLRWNELSLRFTNLKMRDLAERVDPGVGASGALNIDRNTEQLIGGALQLALDGPGVLLSLPA